MSGKPTHGLSYASEYRAWQTMRLRCTNPKNAAYPSYGGRGIKVCDRWLQSVVAFIADMGPKPSPSHELDRRDNDGDYTPQNCRWVTRKVNDRNRRNNRRLELNGVTRTLAEWCELLCLPDDTIHKRLSAGWSAEEALTTAVRSKLPKGQHRSLRIGCADCGEPSRGVRCRRCDCLRRPRDGQTGQILPGNFQEQQQRRVA